jgi:murein DD-endopeptidase MepM/ murein hydrolase activator NlpD
MLRRIAAVAALAGLLAACNAASIDEDAGAARNAAVIQPVLAASANPVPSPHPAVLRKFAGPTTFVFDGELTQGGWIRGVAPGGTVSARLGDTPLVLDDAGNFFAAFDRDAGAGTSLVARLADGREIASPLSVSPRAWNIEHVNVARRSGGPSEAFMRIRRPELARINAARNMDSDSTGWSQDFVWPVKGRISGRFGSQRIYRGEPGSYHSGIDITTGESGTPFVSPVDGVVVLAAETPFSLEGHLLMIDHGAGLNSAFLHCSKIVVKEGQAVTRGQYIGNIGASGRATGPHLHWSLKWRDARLDPLLFTGPMD